MLEDKALTLLDVDDLPNLSGCRSNLAEILATDHDAYKSIIMMIEKGCYPNVVAEAHGIIATTFQRWLQNGYKDLQEEKDTLYSRFTSDIRRALAKARMDVECRVKDKDMKFWLSRGPGRTLSPDWREEAQTIKHEGKIDHVGEVHHVGELRHDGQVGHLHLQGEDLSKVLQELNKAGLIEMNDQSRILITEFTSEEVDEAITEE